MNNQVIIFFFLKIGISLGFFKLFFTHLLKYIRSTFVQILQTNIIQTSALLTVDLRLWKWKFCKATEIGICKPPQLYLSLKVQYDAMLVIQLS